MPLVKQSVRDTVLGLVNSYSKSDPVLWQILKQLAELESSTGRDLNLVQESVAWVLRIQILELTVGTDIYATWPRVYLPRNLNGNQVYKKVRLKTLGISAKPIPTSDLIMDVQVSRNAGVDFASVFETTTTFTLPQDNQTITYGTNTIGTLNDSDIFRFDCFDTGGSDSVEIYLSGQFVD